MDEEQGDEGFLLALTLTLNLLRDEAAQTTDC